jgi:hypothetical protein
MAAKTTRALHRILMAFLHIVAGLATGAFASSEAVAAIGAQDPVNPPAQRRPGIRLVELCTIDPVPDSGNNSRRRGGGGFGFTGPVEFYSDGRMTCYRAKAVMRFRLGYSRLAVHDCNGRQYQIAGFRNGQWDLVTLDALTTQVVRRQPLR